MLANNNVDVKAHPTTTKKQAHDGCETGWQSPSKEEGLSAGQKQLRSYPPVDFFALFRHVSLEVIQVTGTLSGEKSQASESPCTAQLTCYFCPEEYVSCGI
jgi:hypothetical protein